MRPDLLHLPARPLARPPERWTVQGETDRLTDVMLCGPSYLSPVPCCSVTCESLGAGFATDTVRALEEHRGLRAALERHGVRCHLLDPIPDLPDLCFTRDCAVATPWGPVLLNPAMPHRRREVRQVEDKLLALGARPRRVDTGTIEGGDICIARPGLLILGCSGERTSEVGAAAFAAMFRAEGWDVLVCPFDAYHLHLDTIFCMLDRNRALACIEALPPSFLAALAAHGIAVLPAKEAEARQLGCNILSLDGRTILVARGQDRLRTLLGRAGFDVVEIDVSQFAACGGGVHCLTMPLARAL